MPEDLQLFQGTLSHHRYAPKKHRFKYKVFQIWVNLNKLAGLDEISPFWSSKSFNLVRFKRSNYLPSEKSLADQVKSTIREHTGIAFDGDVFMLANLSYWGHCYNPVCFYACYEGETLHFFVSEIHNTPWGERFCYVHQPFEPDASAMAQSHTHVADFNKQFHVSPFMPMDVQYRWRYRLTDDHVQISMNLSQSDTRIFNATLNLRSQALTPLQASLLPFKYPVMGMKVLVGIYWQAFLLWKKGLTFFRHPTSDDRL